MPLRTRPLTALVTLSSAALAATLLTVPPAAADEAPQARVWLTTTDDRSSQLTEQAPVPFGTTPSTAPTVVIDPETAFQTMDGFGASITDSSAAVLYSLPKAQRDEVMRSLFDPVDGIGISILRQPVGSSDFTATAEHYTYDDVAPGGRDLLLRKFSIAHDQAQILPLLRQAKQLNPDLKIIATPWSPPAWMKTGDSLVGGQLKPGYVTATAYAAYLTKYVRAYQAAGVPIDYLTIQNEPQNRAPDRYPGTDMPVADAARVISILGPMLKLASPRTKILGYDHNWATHPGDIGTTPPGADPETDYPAKLLSTPAAKWLAGTAFHCYAGDPSAQTALHEQFPDKGIWFTECSGSHNPEDPPAKFYQETLEWHARNLVFGVTRNWGKTVVNWNLALDERSGPYLGGCTTCTGLVTVADDGTVTRNAEYFTIGHLSKFVEPGAVRIASTSFGTVGWNGQIQDVAFRNPDGSIVLVAHNQYYESRTFAVAIGERTLEYTLPSRALATFVIPPSRAFDDGLAPVDVSAATATATHENAGDPAGNAVDGDASTRWSSGAPQSAAPAITIDLGAAATFRRVSLDSGGNLGDFAQQWALEVSADGVTWTSAATGAGVGQLTQIDLPATTARYLRISASGDVGNWWSVSDVRLYG